MKRHVLHNCFGLIIATAIFGVGAACSNMQTTSRSKDAPAAPSEDQSANGDFADGRTSQIISGTNILSPATLARAAVEGATIVPILKTGAKAIRIASAVRIELKDASGMLRVLFAARNEEFVAKGAYISFPIPSGSTGVLSLVVTDSKSGQSTSTSVTISNDSGSNSAPPSGDAYLI